MNTSRRLARSSTDRIIGGVAGGIANYLDIDPTLVRLAFVLFVLLGGASPFIYLILWAVMPNDQAVGQGFGQQIRTNLDEMGQRASQVASKVSGQVNQLVGNERANQAQQSTPPPAASSPTAGDEPATGPTQRL
jgi:phage shock protein C